MFKNIFDYVKSHASAILATALAVSKAGLLGKVGAAIVSAVAIACGVS
jgi:hypothetical protein